MVKSQDRYDSQEKWISFLEKVYAETNRLLDNKCDIPYYRGHFKTSWELKPSIYRENPIGTITDKIICEVENSLVTDFSALCGQLYNKKLDDWEMIFEIRHAALPTRLLDWTESFANALFFALDGKASIDTIDTIQPCIWILDPFKLNKKTCGKSSIPSADALNFNYHMNEEDWNIYRKEKKGPIAIIPPRHHQRIFAQKSVFTCHFNDVPLEKYYKSCVKKIEVPFECRDQAEMFLFLAGVNDYSLFPDLDGLGRYLQKRKYNPRLLLGNKRTGLEGWYIPTGLLD